MHLLRIEETARDDQAAVDLGQSPAAMVIISAADSDLNALAAAKQGLGTAVGEVRLAPLVRLNHAATVDLYCDQTLSQAKVILVRLLGGKSYWPYGVERILALGKGGQKPLLIFLSGDGQVDEELQRLSTIARDDYLKLHRLFAAGGVAAARGSLSILHGLAEGNLQPMVEIMPPVLPPFGLWEWRADCYAKPPDNRATVAIVFYRALVVADDTAAVLALCQFIEAAGHYPLAIFVPSLKDRDCQEFIKSSLAAAPPDAMITLTGFAAGVGFGQQQESFFAQFDCPIIQVIQASSSKDSWQSGNRGLSPRDLAMSIVLPETDGRIGGLVISFKEVTERDQATQCELVKHRPEPSLIAALVEQVTAWITLRRTPVNHRRIALMLANYPVRDGRIGNGVGLAVPESLYAILHQLESNGYTIQNSFDSAQSMMESITNGATNSLKSERKRGIFYPLEQYQLALNNLPATTVAAVTARWGAPESDPYLVKGSDQSGFILAVTDLGNVTIVVQPPRGYDLDPQSSYHDPALIPPHYYLAVYLWLRYQWRASALVQLGKHGTVEWLPGKSVALSADCWPRAILGSLPLIYPFIVNDPGEGTQAKRRGAAVIIDHLTPPLARAGSYGAQRDLETLIDEYHSAASLDPRRAVILARDIFDLADSAGLLKDCGIESQNRDGKISPQDLAKLDSFICDLKELQIRDGLHVFGQSPTGELLASLTQSLLRVPRGSGEGSNQSLLRALARDLQLPQEFDPLSDEFARDWKGAKPDLLQQQTTDPWRSHGDTVERLELLSLSLVSDLIQGARAESLTAHLPQTRAVLQWLESELLPTITACGHAEMTALFKAIEARFVAAGPSGAPSRGRPEVLPTGRNFYSVDSRNLPTPSAWQLGWRSAQRLVETYEQEQGEPLRSIALSAWGTAQMRTGGDDIAQALALMGVRPRWEGATGRVIGFEIMPVAVLGRCRVDVTLRVSGFFRDAFPEAMGLVDRAAAAVAELAESAEQNPMRAAVLHRQEQLCRESDMTPAAAKRLAQYRVFGSQSGSYGAGLQALMDTGEWRERGTLAAAYMAWSSTAYATTAGEDGASDAGLQTAQFTQLLGGVQAVVHNQDNREHDLLDSDDYYQFEGGLAAAVESARGSLPVIYHNDHSRPETPRIRRLEAELSRVIRGRVANPKWIAGVMRHGYKGVMEMAASLDYIFAFCATTGAVRSDQFDLVYRAWLGEERVVEFMREHNPAALADIERRFAEAMERGFWQPRINWVGQ
ncbi:MAG: cobaltochelatase subunit CobN [Candidatus Pacebacteria bacterium]|nr:cobaltochelatase subunit CobN [Candidatus Paceibacterota bacterium]